MAAIICFGITSNIFDRYLNALLLAWFALTAFTTKVNFRPVLDFATMKNFISKTFTW